MIDNRFEAEDRRLSFWKEYEESWEKTRDYLNTQHSLSIVIQIGVFIELFLVLVGCFVTIKVWVFLIPLVLIILPVAYDFHLDKKIESEDNHRADMRRKATEN